MMRRLSILLTLCCLMTSLVQAQDIWEPWRQTAKGAATDMGYVVDSQTINVVKSWINNQSNIATTGVTLKKSDAPAEPAEYAEFSGENKAIPSLISFEKMELSQSSGVEITWRFRLEKYPTEKMEQSVSLAQFTLKNSQSNTTFYLHAYNRKPGLMLNGLAQNGKEPWKEIVLKRGPALAASAVAFDHQWHTVRMAWCKGTMIVSWDGLVILHIVDPCIDYRSFCIDWVKPTSIFGSLGLAQVEVRRAVFSNTTTASTAEGSH